MRFEDFGIFGVGLVPVDRRKVFTLGKFLVKTPKDLYDTKGSRCDGIRKVSSRRRDAKPSILKL